MMTADESVVDSSGPLFQLQEVHGVFVDACVSDDTGQLLFASFWGRDTAIQGLLARLSLPLTENGLNALTLVDAADAAKRQRLGIEAVERLEKLTGRMPRGNLFGDVVQLWLYERLVVEPDQAARRAIRLRRTDGSTEDAFQCPIIWALFREICHLPLLAHWRQLLLHEAIDRGWLKRHTGIAMEAIVLDLSGEDVEAALTGLIQRGGLTLEATDGSKTLVEASMPSTEPEEPETDTPRKLLTAEELSYRLAYFTGTTQWYRHWLKQMLYTDGVQFFIEEGGEQGAYWFLDIVATECFPLLKQHPFLALTLTVADGKGLLVTDDGRDHELHRRNIEMTDLQPGTWRFYLADNVLLLPSEN